MFLNQEQIFEMFFMLLNYSMLIWTVNTNVNIFPSRLCWLYHSENNEINVFHRMLFLKEVVSRTFAKQKAQLVMMLVLWK